MDHDNERANVNSKLDRLFRESAVNWFIAWGGVLVGVIALAIALLK